MNWVRPFRASCLDSASESAIFKRHDTQAAFASTGFLSRQKFHDVVVITSSRFFSLSHQVRRWTPSSPVHVCCSHHVCPGLAGGKESKTRTHTGFRRPTTRRILREIYTWQTRHTPCTAHRRIPRLNHVFPVSQVRRPAITPGECIPNHRAFCCRRIHQRVVISPVHRGFLHQSYCRVGVCDLGS